MGVSHITILYCRSSDGYRVHSPAATLMVAVQGPHVVRILGLVLMGILIAGSIVIGVMISRAKQADQRRV